MNKKKVKKFILAFLLLSGLFFAQSLFAQTDFGTGAVTSGLNGSLATGDPRTIAGRIINIALGFLGIIAVGIILYAGFKWMTANGDEEKITDAKNILKNGVIGLVIVLSSWAIATFVINKLSGATGGGGDSGCISGSVQPCGCGGSMVCTNDTWGSCVGSNLNNCVTPPKTCDSNAILAGCQAANQICVAGYFCDDSCSCQKQGDAGASCDLDTTNATCDADNNRCSEYSSCDPTSCLCVGSPVITGVSPVGGFCKNNINSACLVDKDCGAGDTCDIITPNGTTNNFITISGKNFGAYSEGSSNVAFLGNNSSIFGLSPTSINSACFDTWTDSQIIIAVPTGVQTGPIKVINNDLSDATNDDRGPTINNFVANSISRPGLCSLDPVVGVLSSEVNYQGVNLYSGTAYFGNYNSNVSALYSVFENESGLSGTSTTPNIRAGESGSFVETSVAGSLQKSNYLEFTKAADENSGPYITSFTPSKGKDGQYITIKGAGFGGARGSNHVYFVSGSSKIEASYSFPTICSNSVWSDNQIIVKTPAMADDYYQIQITLGDVIISTQNLNPNTFQFDQTSSLKTSLCKMDPTQGPIDTPVTLWGEYFYTKNSNIGLVQFNYEKRVSGNIGKENDADIINVSVPSGATTGPVKVIKNDEWGNELNFAVGECTTDNECSGKICCPQNTYKKGRCVSDINECFSNVPNSVFEWSFSTSFATTTDPNIPIVPTFDSCLGLSKYLGSCYQGASCPNSPGACSSPSASYQKTVGTCDKNCNDASGCNGLTCTYMAVDSSNNKIDKCVQNKAAGKGVCDFPAQVSITKEVNADTNRDIPRIMYWSGKVNQHWNLEKGVWETDPDGISGSTIDKVTYCKKFYPTAVAVEKYKIESSTWYTVNKSKYVYPSLSYRCVLSTDIYDVEKTCNSSGKWEISLDSSCPYGWTKTGNSACTQNGASCNICDANLSCQKVNAEGRCVSAKICSDKDATCIDNPLASEADKCVITAAPTCECCCRIGYDKQDCCAGLTCAGKCGSDINNDSKTYGSCSGCAKIGNTVAEHDAGCNCTGHGSQYCEIDDEHPGGICTDCSGIDSQTDCGDHSSACCFDSNKTATTTDDYCRGVSGLSVISKDKNNSNYGYCAYYGCYSANNLSPNYPSIPVGDPYECASTTPVKIGFFNKIDTCVKDCPTGVGTDVCHTFDNNQPGCSGENKCCYDQTTSKCLSGNQISEGESKGYCAYYDCQTPPGNPFLCDATPTTTPISLDIATCTTKCANPPIGPGVVCDDKTGVDLKCNFNACNAAGFACLQDDGKGGSSSNCGTCCCTPETASTADSCVSVKTPNLHCQAGAGTCTGASRGLCCGCSNDSECGSVGTEGCGSSTCCQARPSIVQTSPTAAETNVCRNAAIKISFDQKMDVNSLNANFLLYEERTYGDGVCPAGTFLADARTVENIINPQNKNIFVRLWESINSGIRRLFGQANKQVLAEAPATNKLYCTVPGAISTEQNGSQTDLIFNPLSALAPSTKYYAVIKGDEGLNSQTGVLSSVKIGMNGQGFNDGGTFISSDQIKFNTSTYLNSYSFQFNTLSSQGPNSGFCAIDHVSIRPSSHLFSTTVNSIDEKDDNVAVATFDTISDRDKVFSVGAYSARGQLLNPVAGYNWHWNWSLDDTSVADILNSVIGLTENKSFVAAKAGVTDSETKLRAAINMNGFNPTSGCVNSCNKIFAGDAAFNTSDIYVFVCENPWPAVKANGDWSPWNDSSDNCSSGACSGYNYKFYYCRDAGAAGTLDDLPAISSLPISKGINLLCSSGNAPCPKANEVCGVDGAGVCLWNNVLKESYFFREAVLSGGNIITAVDTQKGGEIGLNWQSPISNIYSYKIYYLRSGRGSMMTKEIKPVGACSIIGSVYDCRTIISGLTNNQLYIFKLTVISTNKTESALSTEKSAIPTDKVAPSAPSGLSATVSGSQINFSWKANADDTASYRLYRGIKSGSYVEASDSAGTGNSLSLPLSQFSEGLNYFAISAIDGSKNESAKSIEVQYYYANNDYWYKALAGYDTPSGRKCAVKIAVDKTTNEVDCATGSFDGDPKGIYMKFFEGKIVIHNNPNQTPYCSVASCPTIINGNKCAWSEGLNPAWSNQCYIHN